MSEISFDIRRKQLGNLISALKDLIQVLEKDQSCQLIRHFQISLLEAEKLFTAEFTQEDLILLSSKLNSVYDLRQKLKYEPKFSDDETNFWRSIKDTENFETFASAVYERSLELRVVG